MRQSFHRIVCIYGITAVIFFLIDLLWIGILANDFYAENIGGLLRDSVNWPAAFLFYLIYIGGIVHFVLVPSLDSGKGMFDVALKGGLLGLFAYGTFDLTALALLKDWPVAVTIVDMAWGTFLTAAVSSSSLWIANIVLKTGGRSR